MKLQSAACANVYAIVKPTLFIMKWMNTTGQALYRINKNPSDVT
ncbi:MAG: hypothetical protein OEV78_03505 [Spirochaetia bacterium]|nr:hypothetical protein [Spirochaetia bacterium]